MARPNKSGIEWGRKIRIPNTRNVGLERVVMPDSHQFFVQVRKDEDGIDEKNSKVYASLNNPKDLDFYREVLGAKKQKVIGHYISHGPEDY